MKGEKRDILQGNIVKAQQGKKEVVKQYTDEMKQRNNT